MDEFESNIISYGGQTSPKTADNAEPVKEHKKPGPKPKSATKSNEATNNTVSHSMKPTPANTDVTVKAAEESASESKSESKAAEESKTSITDNIVETSTRLVYRYTNPAIIYSGPSNARPICSVISVELLDEVKNGFIKCVGFAPSCGKIKGYVHLISGMSKLISDSNNK